MKRKQLCSLITVALMATTLVTPYNTSETQAKEETSVKAASLDNAPFSYSFQKGFWAYHHNEAAQAPP